MTTRRRALAALASTAALRAQQDPFRDHSRVPAMEELIHPIDFEAVAYAKLPRQAYDYTSYGAEGEFTLRRNRQAFDWVDLIPRSLADVRAIDTSLEIFGMKMAYPLFAAPTAGHAELHPDGELATHRGLTAASDTPMIVSNNATFGMDKIAAAATGPLWFQLYPRRNLEDSRMLLESVQAAGAKAIVVTLDQQASYYERALHDRHLGTTRHGTGAAAPTAHNPYRVPEARTWYYWDYLNQIQRFLKVPMLAKGILTAEDARLAVEHGCAGIVVSNHGGRSLDYDPSTLEVLPEIVAAVGSRVPVLVDGGFRSGSDVLKGLALGAKAVCLGRTVRWGLAAYGAAGVQRMLEIFQAELRMAMAETGCGSLAAVNPKLVQARFA